MPSLICRYRAQGREVGGTRPAQRMPIIPTSLTMPVPAPLVSFQQGNRHPGDAEARQPHPGQEDSSPPHHTPGRANPARQLRRTL